MGRNRGSSTRAVEAIEDDETRRASRNRRLLRDAERIGGAGPGEP